MWWMVFLGASLAVALTPGANNLLGMHHAVHHGAGRAARALSGRLAAFALLIAAVVAGLGPLLAASRPALTAITWAGAAYLVWLGMRMILATFRDGSPPSGHPAAAPAGGRPDDRLVRKEFLVAITNPKALLLFTAFLPQFVEPAAGPVALQLVVLGASYLLVEAVAGTAYVLIGSALRAVRLSARAQRRVDRGTGAVLLGMAGALALSRP
ncbi:MAG TPA: LysE family translocator [Pseudonocardia sp.]|nr:LysE family translocator [Pseudonocardia sp.]